MSRLAAIVVIVLTACVLPGAASAETVPLPPGAAATQNDYLNAVACPSAGDCVGVGGFTDAGGVQSALVEVEQNGAWTASAPDLSTVDPGGGQAADLLSVACSSAGNCVAVGRYADSSGDDLGLVLTETDGTWAAQPASLSGLSSIAVHPDVVLDSVACPAAGECVAVGTYRDASDHTQGLIETETGGGWSAGTAPLSGLTTGTDPRVQLLQVSCASAGNCAAVGGFQDPGGNPVGLLEADTDGSWGAAAPNLSQVPSAAASQNEQVRSVSCPSDGECTAVGYFKDGSGTFQALLVSQSGAGWNPASEATLPADAAASPGSQFDLSVNSVSCSSAGDCTAVGSYDATSANDVEGLELTETNGTWATGVAVSLPAASAGNPEATLASVVCTSATHCEAAGSFEGSDGENQALVAQQSGSTWAAASVAQPVAYDNYGYNSASVACASDGYCAAAGYTRSSAAPSPDTAWLLAAPTSAGDPSVTVKATTGNVTWTPPGDTGGLPITGYSVLANDLTNASRGGQVVAVGTSGGAPLTGLRTGDTYTFTVSAISVVGNGIPATTADVFVAASRRQISASLTRLLAPKGARGRLKSLRRTHRYRFTYKALESGRVTVRWYHITAHRKHAKKHLVASGSRRPSRAGTVRVHLRMTALGRRLVKSSNKLKLTARVTFTGHGVTVTRTRKFTLH